MRPAEKINKFKPPREAKEGGTQRMRRFPGKMIARLHVRRFLPSVHAGAATTHFRALFMLLHIIVYPSQKKVLREKKKEKRLFFVVFSR